MSAVLSKVSANGFKASSIRSDEFLFTLMLSIFGPACASLIVWKLLKFLMSVDFWEVHTVLAIITFVCLIIMVKNHPDK